MSTTDKSDFDAIVIGGGHNGLVTANYLAMSGLKVCVLEQRHIVGGAAVKGPLGHMIPSLAGRPASASAVADHYGQRLKGWVVEDGDQHEFANSELLLHGTATVMKDRAASKRLAMELLLLAERLLP